MPKSTPNIGAPRSTAPDRARAVLDWLERKGTDRVRDGMTRYGIPNASAFGVPVGVLQGEAKRLGRDHSLAAALWKTGRYEARLMAAFIGEPAKVTVAQMDRWCGDFDSWAVCDSVYLHLVDRSPHAWGREATDDRNFVKKSVHWALRAIGRRSRSLNVAVMQAAERLAASPDATARRIGRDALRKLVVEQARLAARGPRATARATS